MSLTSCCSRCSLGAGAQAPQPGHRLFLRLQAGSPEAAPGSLTPCTARPLHPAHTRARHWASGPWHMLCALPWPHRPVATRLSLSSEAPRCLGLGPALRGAWRGTSTHRCPSSRWVLLGPGVGKVGGSAKDMPVDSSAAPSGHRRGHPNAHPGLNTSAYVSQTRGQTCGCPGVDCARRQKQTRAPGAGGWGRPPMGTGSLVGAAGGLQSGAVAALPGYDTETPSCAF